MNHIKTYTYTIFESNLSYGIIVWGGVSYAKINYVFVAHNYGLRI